MLWPEAGGVARRPGGQQGGWENSKAVRGSLGSLGVSEDVGQSGRKPGAIDEEARGFVRRMPHSLSGLVDIQVAGQRH